jgi:stress-induced morphogen
MAMQAHEIKDMILKAMPNALIEIEDLAGDGEHYRAIVTDSSFSGLSRVQQHKQVYDALGGKAGTVLHALALTTKIPVLPQE